MKKKKTVVSQRMLDFVESTLGQKLAVPESAVVVKKASPPQTSAPKRSEQSADVSRAEAKNGGPHDGMPVCVDCGGRPQLGRQRGSEIVSICRACADAEYLAQLSPESRALLRNQ